MCNKDYFYNFTIHELSLTLWTYRQTLVNNEDARKYSIWILHYQRYCGEILRERWNPSFPDIDFVFNNSHDLNETLDPNGMDAEDYIKFLIRAELKIKRLCRKRHRNCILIRAELKIKRLCRKRHRNCRGCKESLSEKRPCLRVKFFCIFLV